MKKKTPILIAAALAALTTVGGGGSAFALSNEVTVQAYGKTETIRTFDTKVSDILESQDVELKETDLVQPAAHARVDSGDTISVVERTEVSVNVDGRTSTVLTSGDQVADALEYVEVDLANAAIDPAPETPLSEVDGEISVVTAKDVTFTGMNGTWTAKGTTAKTVQDALDKHFSDSIDDDDVIEPGRDTILQDGMVVRLVRISAEESTKTEEIPFETKTTKDSSMYEDETKVKVQGVKGERTIVTKTTTTDGKVTGEEVVREEVTKKPVTEEIVKGTKKRPAAASESSKKDSGSSNSASSSRSSKSGDTAQSGTPSGNASTCGASYYGNGDGFDGQLTANGERFNTHALTAAHKTLPFGTRVRVTNVSNGKSVVVRINDRGPYVSGRCLDLSYAAMKQIGGVSAGHIKVEWVRVN